MSTSFYNVDLHDGQETLSSTMLFSDRLLTAGKCLRHFTNSHILYKFNRWVHESEDRLCEEDGTISRVSFSKLIQFCLNPQLVIFRSVYIARLRALGCALERTLCLGILPDADEIIHIYVPQREQDVAESKRFASMDMFESTNRLLLSDERLHHISSSTLSCSPSPSSSSSSARSSAVVSDALDDNILPDERDALWPDKREKRRHSNVDCDDDDTVPCSKKRAHPDNGTE
jgi:hypothetical protein